jgi:hypothetical protein
MSLGWNPVPRAGLMERPAPRQSRHPPLTAASPVPPPPAGIDPVIIEASGCRDLQRTTRLAGAPAWHTARALTIVPVRLSRAQVTCYDRGRGLECDRRGFLSNGSDGHPNMRCARRSRHAHPPPVCSSTPEIPGLASQVKDRQSRARATQRAVSTWCKGRPPGAPPHVSAHPPCARPRAAADESPNLHLHLARICTCRERV